MPSDSDPHLQVASTGGGWEERGPGAVGPGEWGPRRSGIQVPSDSLPHLVHAGRQGGTMMCVM